MALDPSDPETFEDDYDAEGLGAGDLFDPEYASESDRADQARVVELNEDDYR